jgi:predicted nucleotidyltransferase
MMQEEILKKVIPELRADSSITAVMLMGSVAKGIQYPTSDLDLFILCNRNKFETEIIDGILVEYLYITQETAQSKLDKAGMEVYHYLGSKIIYDLDGRLIKLMRSAMNKYKNYKIGDKEKIELRHWLYSTRIKINAAIGKQEFLKADFITATISWKAIEAIFAVNNIPLPPTSSIITELSKLYKVPEVDWFIKLFQKDTNKRTDTMLSIIDWVLLSL